MNLPAKASAYLSTLSMSVPSRMALWLGLALMVFGYMRNQAAFTLVGLVLIMTGIILWLVFRPKGGGWRSLLGFGGGPSSTRGKDLVAKKKSGFSLPGKFGARKREINEAVSRAQEDPLFQTRRPRVEKRVEKPKKTE